MRLLLCPEKHLLEKMRNLPEKMSLPAYPAGLLLGKMRR